MDEFYDSIKTIRENLVKCGAEEQGRVFHKEFNRAVIQLSREEAHFDFIFLDPPYRLLDKRNPLKVIFKREILKPDGRIILRHHFKTRFESNYFNCIRRVSIGDDVLLFFSL